MVRFRQIKKAVAKEKRKQGYEWRLVVFDVDRKSFLGEETFASQADYERRIDEICGKDMLCYDGYTGETFTYETRFGMATCRL